MDPEIVAETEGDRLALLASAGLRDDDACSMSRLCALVTGSPPLRGRISTEAATCWVHGAPRVFVRAGVAVARARWLVGHELAEVYYARRGFIGDDIERRCDLLGASLVLSPRTMRQLLREYGHSPRAIADATGTTRALALLRIGEVTGRPVRLLGERERVRGGAFVWPDTRRSLRGHHRDVVHPVRLTDEDKIGLMAVEW